MHADEQLVGEREHGHSRRVLCLVIRLSKYGFVAMVQVSPNGDQFGSKRPQSNATSIRSDKRISPSSSYGGNEYDMYRSCGKAMEREIDRRGLRQGTKPKYILLGVASDECPDLPCLMQAPAGLHTPTTPHPPLRTHSQSVSSHHNARKTN